MNFVSLAGRLTRDPEIRYTKTKKAVASFTLAVDDGKGDNGRKAQFLPCVAWEDKAEFLDQYFKKGDGVMITGKLQARSYEQDGKKRTAVEVIVSGIEFPLSRRSDDERQEPVKDAFSEYDGDDDLPF